MYARSTDHENIGRCPRTSQTGTSNLAKQEFGSYVGSQLENDAKLLVKGFLSAFAFFLNRVDIL